MGIRGAYAVCEKHGSEIAKGVGKKMVRAPVPKTKKQRYHSGCPQCKKDARDAVAL
jgi:hypothetical protein